MNNSEKAKINKLINEEGERDYESLPPGDEAAFKAYIKRSIRRNQQLCGLLDNSDGDVNDFDYRLERMKGRLYPYD